MIRYGVSVPVTFTASMPMMRAASVKSSGGHSSRSGSRSHKGSDQKTTRIRTVLNEKQLHTLRTCYGANPRPDALMKEQLVEMTGLSPRVIRVWFQNKRCKDKKRSILMKQLQLQQQQQQQQHQDKVFIKLQIRCITWKANALYAYFLDQELISYCYNNQVYSSSYSCSCSCSCSCYGEWAPL